MEYSTNLNKCSWIERDLEHIWHPFTQMFKARHPIPIIKGEGVYLYSHDGQRYIDGISSWWVNLHGHCHPHIMDKIQRQLSNLEHVIFADFTHEPAVELASQLKKILPGPLSKIFYSDNGSTAVEAAIKMSLQYWYNQNPKTKKTKMICFRKGYHGDTFGAMSAAGRNELNTPFWKHLFAVEMIDLPLRGQEAQSIEQLKIHLNSEQCAAFIFEPLILGSGGMLIYPPEALDVLLNLCHDHGVLTIADEVMTGFGRTGSLFACENLHEKVDIICLSKGITGGFLPLGVTACTQAIYEAFLGEQLEKAFLHGHSYSANPLACAAALGNLDLLLQEECSLQRHQIEQSHQKFCRQWAGHPRLKRCEVQGTILVIEYLVNEGTTYFQAIRDELYHFFLDHHILLRPLGNVVYVLPPYCIQEEQLQAIYKRLVQTFTGNFHAFF